MSTRTERSGAERPVDAIGRLIARSVLLPLLLPRGRGYLNAGRGDHQNHHRTPPSAVHLLHGPARLRHHSLVRTHTSTTVEKTIPTAAMSAATACMPLVPPSSPLHGSAAMAAAEAVEKRQPGGMETTKTAGSEGDDGDVVMIKPRAVVQTLTCERKPFGEGFALWRSIGR